MDDPDAIAHASISLPPMQRPAPGVFLSPAPGEDYADNYRRTRRRLSSKLKKQLKPQRAEERPHRNQTRTG